LAEGGTARLTLPFEADLSGIATFKTALTLPNKRILTQSQTLEIRQNDPKIQRRAQFNLAAGSTFTVDQNVFAGFTYGSASVTLAAGPMARFDVPGMLNALDQYPYGCTEQVTSKALPLLYLDQIATSMGLAERDNIAKRIADSIALVLSNQASNGAFGLWRPDRGDLWLDAYVTDFLSRAQRQGHDVPQIAFRQALDNLRNAVNSAPDFDRGGEGLAYALLVLTREGAAAIGDLRYYADVKASDFATPLASAQLGAALAAYGDPTRADAMFRVASAQLASPEPKARGFRGDYGSDLRDAAAVLTLAVEAGSDAIDVASLHGSNPRKTCKTPSSERTASWARWITLARSRSNWPTCCALSRRGSIITRPPASRTCIAQSIAPGLTLGGSSSSEDLAQTSGRGCCPLGGGLGARWCRRMDRRDAHAAACHRDQPRGARSQW